MLPVLPIHSLNRRGGLLKFCVCGSWLACDGITAVLLIHRVVCIAGKPAPTLDRISCPALCIFRAGGYESTLPTG
ncbi:hypothetical protein BTR19_19275 [Pseudomonas fluorescens]|nr:hypothetical protein BTR19_19275 [Pseudomonas fluorescens]